MIADFEVNLEALRKVLSQQAILAINSINLIPSRLSALKSIACEDETRRKNKRNRSQRAKARSIVLNLLALYIIIWEELVDDRYSRMIAVHQLSISTYYEIRPN